jgi:hypothetical protein
MFKITLDIGITLWILWYSTEIIHHVDILTRQGDKQKEVGAMHCNEYSKTLTNKLQNNKQNKLHGP